MGLGQGKRSSSDDRAWLVQSQNPSGILCTAVRIRFACLKNMITDVVRVTVVDVFEAIEVNERQLPTMTGAPRGLWQHAEAVRIASSGSRPRWVSRVWRAVSTTVRTFLRA